MTLSGWLFMIVSWAAILGMFTFCMSRTLRPLKRNGPKNTDTDNKSGY